MLILYTIAAIVAVIVLGGVIYLLWCVATCVSNGFDCGETYVGPREVARALHRLQAAEHRYAILEDLEVDPEVLEGALADVDEARAACEAAQALAGNADAASTDSAGANASQSPVIAPVPEAGTVSATAGTMRLAR